MVRGSFFTRRRKQPEKSEENFSVEIGPKLEENLDDLKKMLDGPGDLIIRKFTAGSTDKKCAIVYIDGLVDKDLVNNNILKAVQYRTKQIEEDVMNEMYQEIIAITDIKKTKILDDVSFAILTGGTALYLDGTDTVLIMGTAGGESRSIKEPQSEQLIRGPRDGFVENIQTNMALIRHDIRDPNLRFKAHEIGRRSKQKLVVSYIDGIVHPDIVKEVNRRLETIDIDFAPESGYVEQWIEDNFLSPFPQLMNTERPDKASTAILQGKVVIILDGTPFVLIAPITFGNTLQSPEDYYERWTVGTFLRAVRYFAAFIAMFLPSLYIALVSYHPGMIPSNLAFSIAATREGVPFPAFIEAISMGITMELLREAGSRLPKAIGQTIGIVGGLVIGEAAVSAGIVSPIMVIVVALTAIASFTNPSYSAAIAFRIIRFSFMIAAAVLGLYGIILVYIMLNIHMVNLKSIGTPYTAPFAPSFLADWKDLVIRTPLTMLSKRPAYMQPIDEKSVNKGEQQS
ncbi:spore germination protein [Virgibacillus ainsalahensis]